MEPHEHPIVMLAEIIVKQLELAKKSRDVNNFANSMENSHNEIIIYLQDKSAEIAHKLNVTL